MHNNFIVIIVRQSVKPQHLKSFSSESGLIILITLFVWQQISDAALNLRRQYTPAGWQVATLTGERR